MYSIGCPELPMVVFPKSKTKRQTLIDSFGHSPIYGSNAAIRLFWSSHFRRSTPLCTAMAQESSSTARPYARGFRQQGTPIGGHGNVPSAKMSSLHLDGRDWTKLADLMAASSINTGSSRLPYAVPPLAANSKPVSSLATTVIPQKRKVEPLAPSAAHNAAPQEWYQAAIEKRCACCKQGPDAKIKQAKRLEKGSVSTAIAFADVKSSHRHFFLLNSSNPSRGSAQSVFSRSRGPTTPWRRALSLM